jgi:cytochrome b subunit of formate dehydrogenase
MDQGIMTLITVGVVLGIAGFVLWLLYTVIWRAVRRGMREFELAQPSAAVPAVAGMARHHLRHRVPADAVPDYPPSEWF